MELLPIVLIDFVCIFGFYISFFEAQRFACSHWKPPRHSAEAVLAFDRQNRDVKVIKKLGLDAKCMLVPFRSACVGFAKARLVRPCFTRLWVDVGSP